MLWCYSLQYFFLSANPNTHTHKIRLLTKKRNFILAGFCSLYDLAQAEIADGREDLSPKNFLMYKCWRLFNHSSFPPSLSLSHTCRHTHTLPPSLKQRRILIEWQETRTEWSGKDMTSATTNNKRCKGASFPKLFQKCKMGTKTLHFLLRTELSESALLQHHRQRVLWTSHIRGIKVYLNRGVKRFNL